MVPCVFSHCVSVSAAPQKNFLPGSVKPLTQAQRQQQMKMFHPIVLAMEAAEATAKKDCPMEALDALEYMHPQFFNTSLRIDFVLRAATMNMRCGRALKALPFLFFGRQYVEEHFQKDPAAFAKSREQIRIQMAHVQFKIGNYSAAQELCRLGDFFEAPDPLDRCRAILAAIYAAQGQYNRSSTLLYRTAMSLLLRGGGLLDMYDLTTKFAALEYQREVEAELNDLGVDLALINDGDARILKPLPLLVDILKEINPSRFVSEAFRATTPNDMNGGWSNATTELYASERCNIEQIHISDLQTEARNLGLVDQFNGDLEKAAAEVYNRKYLARNVPVVVRGVVDPWPAVERWRKENFVNIYGNRSLRARRGSDIAADNVAQSKRDPAQREEKLAAQQMTIKQFVEEHMGRLELAQQQYRNGNTSGPLYELEPKDPMYILDNPWREMLEAHDYPEPLEPWFSPEKFSTIYDYETRHSISLLYLGPANAGTQFHSHTTAWNVLLYGEKRWFMYPPYLRDIAESNHYANDTVSMAEWVNSSYPHVQNYVFECTQHPGDMFLVPGRWEHAILNTKDSIGLANQVGEYQTLVDALVQTAFGQDHLERLLRASPRNYFEVMDFDMNGSIDENEYFGYLGDSLRKRLEFRRDDKDRDGRISFAEFNGPKQPAMPRRP
eukprot:INCI5869.9.p1 GENE.INCI5869.9~~INCI5869.9.p1  ORF type:complete len:668 (+),score=114.18 INCI5869.9:958-2961(+)